MRNRVTANLFARVVLPQIRRQCYRLFPGIRIRPRISKLVLLLLPTIRHPKEHRILYSFPEMGYNGVGRYQPLLRNFIAVKVIK